MRHVEAPKLLKKKSPNYLLLYTLIFIGVFALTYQYFLICGKSMVCFNDGRHQHYNSLMYYGKWLREILSNVFLKGSFNFATYSFSMGYGGDIIQILHYYVLGDPLDLLSVFVPCKFTLILYYFLIVLRLYLAGLAFSKLCFYFNTNRSKAIVLAGAITYVFSGYAFFSATRHPYFINPMIYFPILIIGVEKIFKKESPVLFTLFVFVSAVSNLYFFYIIVIMTVLYVIIRIIAARRQLGFREAALFVLKLGAFSVLAVVMASAVLAPVIIQFLFDPRNVRSNRTDLLYPIKYYKDFLNQFLSIESKNEYWTYIGMTGLSLPATFVLFNKRKQRSLLKIAFIVMTIFTLIPFFGKLINGMNYTYNRWLWAYALLVSYIIVETSEELMKLSKRQYIYCGLFLLAYFALCVLSEVSFSDSAVTQLLIAVFVAAAAFVVSGSQNDFLVSRRVGGMIVLIAAVAGVGFSAYFGIAKSDFFEYYYDAKHFSETFSYNEAALIEKEYKGGFGRYTGKNLFRNVSLQHNTPTTQFYFSLSNPNIFQLFNELDLNVTMGQTYDGLDCRTALDELSNVKYFISTDIDTTKSGKIKNNTKGFAPYGFDRKGELWAFNDRGELFSGKSAEALNDESLVSKYAVHKNKNFLPFGYTYSSYISKNEYNRLSTLDRQEAMLQSVVLEDDIDDIQKGSPTFTSKKVDYTVKSQKNNSAVTDSSVVAFKEGAEVELSFDGLKNSETYLYIKGLNFKNCTERDLYTDDKTIDPYDEYTSEDFETMPALKQRELNTEAKQHEELYAATINVFAKGKCPTVKNRLRFYTPSFRFYEGKHDFMVNLGYSKNAKNKIILALQERGAYSFDSIEVYCQPMDNYKSQVKALKEDTMKNVNFHTLKNSGATNEITGYISLKENKIVLLSVPYSSGWTAYVDGKEAKILKANTMFSALKLQKGDHTIRLTYDTPAFKLGLILSVLGFAAFIALILLTRKKRVP